MNLRAIKARYFDGSLLKRRLLSGSAWALGGKLGGATVGIVTNGLLTRILPPEEFGAYVLALSIVTFGSIVGSLGVPKTIVRYVAENVGLNQFGRVRRSISLMIGIGVLGTLVSSLAYYFFIGDLVGRYIFDSPTLVAVTGLTAGWMAIAVVQEITAEAFRGFHDIRWATLLGGLATGGKSGGLVMRGMMLACLCLLWWTSVEVGLGTVIIISIAAGSASLILSFWLLRGRVSSLEPQGEENPVTTREILNDALPYLVIALTTFGLQSADIWIVGAFRAPEEVGVYGAAARLVAFVTMPLLIINLVLPPITAEMYAQGKMEKLERTLRTFSTLAGIPSLLVLVVFMFLGGPILGIVYGNPIYQSSMAVLVLVLLSSAKLVAVWAGSCGMVLQFTGHQGAMLRVSLLTSPLFIIGALLVVRDYGLVGVAGAAAATTTLQNIVMVLVAKRKTGMWTHVTLSPSFIKKVLSSSKQRQ